jgi:1-acyl-sn-glycerol-3-phosphate acyltransferase
MQDIVGALYLLWPVTILGAIVFFLAGILFAISVGSILVIGLLLMYYAYIYAKKRGFFEWLQAKHKIVGEALAGHVRETFLLKGNLVLPEGPVLYVAHPHGLFSMAPFLHWAAQVTAWSSRRPVRIAIHSIFFRIPIVREVCEHFRAIEATDEEIRKVIESGESVALLTGGVRELSMTEPGKMILVLKKRRGFARLAKELGVPIVPVLTFGENELFPPISGFWTNWIQTYLHKILGISIPLPTWQSVKHWFLLLKGPLPAKVETWIGEPVETTKIQTETIRAHVVKAFEKLYAEGRPSGYPLTMEIH